LAWPARAPPARSNAHRSRSARRPRSALKLTPRPRRQCHAPAASERPVRHGTWHFPVRSRLSGTSNIVRRLIAPCPIVDRRASTATSQLASALAAAKSLPRIYQREALVLRHETLINAAGESSCIAVHQGSPSVTASVPIFFSHTGICGCVLESAAARDAPAAAAPEARLAQSSAGDP